MALGGDGYFLDRVLRVRSDHDVEAMMKTTDAARLVLAIFDDLLPDDRLEVLGEIEAKFCRGCGLLHPDEGRCQCQNDD